MVFASKSRTSDVQPAIRNGGSFNTSLKQSKSNIAGIHNKFTALKFHFWRIDGDAGEVNSVSLSKVNLQIYFMERNRDGKKGQFAFSELLCKFRFIQSSEFY